MNRPRPIIRMKPKPPPVDEVDTITAREVLGMLLVQAKHPNVINPPFLTCNEDLRVEIRETADRWVEHIRQQERDARAGRAKLRGAP